MSATEVPREPSTPPDGEPQQQLARGIVVHAATGAPLAGARVVASAEGDKKKEAPLGSATTGAAGAFAVHVDGTIEAQQRACALRIDPEERLLLRVVDADGSELARTTPDDATSVVIALATRGKPDRETYRHVASTLAAAREARVGDVTGALSNPRPDSPLVLLSVADRTALLDRLARGLQTPRRPDGSADDPVEERAVLDDDRVLDLDALGKGKVVLEPATRVPNPWVLDQTPDFQWPGFGAFGWAKPDDQSYRDYLRGVFVLYAHQQAVGFGGNVSQWTTIVEAQLRNRFFQDFATEDRAGVPLNSLLVPVVTEILKAPSGSGFGFGVPPASIPPQGTLTSRQYLDVLIGLTTVTRRELSNRFRLPLDEPDSVISNKVLLNVHTLQRVLSDTAQGPVEPPENVIFPPLPGFGERVILWDVVVGAAPFYLRFEEWLERQRPFFAENHFSLRTQVQAHWNAGPWLDEANKHFLDFHATLTTAGAYGSHFATASEARRAALFLLAFGAADAKLHELLAAIDRQEYPKALRLVGEAATLLRAAEAKPGPGENWEPVQTPSSNPRSLSFLRRRRLQVKTIVQLGGEGLRPDQSLERFLSVPKPGIRFQGSVGLWDYVDLARFSEARFVATRLVRYQRAFLLPLLEAHCRIETGDYAGALVLLGRISGFYVGMALAATPAGAAYDPDDSTERRAVHQKGTLPYTVRLTYDEERWLVHPDPFSKQRAPGPSAELGPDNLHTVEERYVRLLQADVMLRWADVLYRTDDPSSLERTRELYKGVVFLHDEEPGTSAYERLVLSLPPLFGKQDNPRRHAQLERARLALIQLEAGLNYYGYRDDLVPTLRYRTLVDAAGRWSSSAKAAQNDFLGYQSRLEQLDLDVLAARAQQKKAQAYVGIAAEQVEIAKAGVVSAQRLVKDVEKRIEEKRKEIEDADSLFGQYKDYFSGMKDSVSSLVDVGKAAQGGASATGIASEAEAKAAMKGLGKEALAGTGAGGAAAVGAIGAFAVLSYVTLDGMATAATRRAGELAALRNEALPAAQAVVRVNERQVRIAELQGDIAKTDRAYATDLIAYHGERFLNRDFWFALTGIARQSMHRQLDLAARAAWLAERSLAYEIGRPVGIVRLDYFDARLRDVGGVDRLLLDLAELEAVRIGSAHLTVPIRRTYSLARDFPLAYGALKRRGRCSFAVSEADLTGAYPGTFAYRLRAVTVGVEAPGATVPPRGMLSNRGLSFVRRSATEPSLPLARFEDALPVSEFRLRADMAVHGMPGEQLMPFEGSGFETTWELEFPPPANPAGLARLTDVLLTFDVRAEYAGAEPPVAVAPTKTSRAIFVSALSLDTDGLATLRTSGATAKVRFPLARLANPGVEGKPKLTNLAVLLPGVDSGTVKATLRRGSANPVAFTIEKGLALSNNAHLSDGVPANAHPLNALANAKADQTFELELTKSGVAKLLAAARDVILWAEYQHD